LVTLVRGATGFFFSLVFFFWAIRFGLVSSESLLDKLIVVAGEGERGCLFDCLVAGLGGIVMQFLIFNYGELDRWLVSLNSHYLSDLLAGNNSSLSNHSGV
jgi:hypothetical protein